MWRKEEPFLRSPKSSEKAARIQYGIPYQKHESLEILLEIENWKDLSQDRNMEGLHCSQDS